MNISDAIISADDILGRARVAEPRREAASLLAFCLGRESSFLIAHPEYELTGGEIENYRNYIYRRANREPFQYIVGRQEFYGLDFVVTPGVLIPRPETEQLVENAIGRLGRGNSPRFLEIGVGSGCISVSILAHVGTATALAVDISAAALAVAAENAARHGVEDRLRLSVSDVYSAVDDPPFDAIVANPPYVPAADLETLQPEVSEFEPAAALTDGGDGLSIVRRIVMDAPNHLAANGLVMIEFGFGQDESVKSMFDPGIWNAVDVLCDLQGIPRMVSAVLI